MNTESQILNVPIEDIIPNRFQPRLKFDEDGLKELAASIKEHGIIQPLVLRRLGDKYEIIAGERRYKASKMAGLTSVPAIVSNIDDKKSAEVSIVENIQRRDLSSIEEARSYKNILDKGYLTQEELAKKMGLSQSAISNKLRLLALSPVVQDALIHGKISERHARSLLQVEDLKMQDEWLKRIIDERITVRELEKKLKEENSNKNGNEPNIVEIPPVPSNIDNKVEEFLLEPQSNSITTESLLHDKSVIPNKFFNFLEDESLNMNNLDNTNEEEIELLDFDVPVNNITNIKDMKIAEDLIEKLNKELKEKNYSVEITKDETTSELKYTIIINKE